MPAPIIAAFDPYTADTAPIVLAVGAAELTGSTVIAVAVYPWSLADEPSDLDGDPQRLVANAMREVHDEFGVDTQIVTDLSVPRGPAPDRAREAGRPYRRRLDRPRSRRPRARGQHRRAPDPRLLLPRCARPTRLPALRHQDDCRRVRRLTGGS